MKKIIGLILALVMIFVSVPCYGADGEKAETGEVSSLNPGDYFSFGTYPCARVDDKELLSSLDKIECSTQKFGYLRKNENDKTAHEVNMLFADIEYEGEKYRKVIINEYRPSFSVNSDFMTSFQADNGYFKGETYYFKYSPLKWKVLSVDGGKIFALSANIIDACVYSDSVKKVPWEESRIRSFLNNDFYNAAFSDGEKENLISSGDFVSLLSYEDAINEKYGFSSDAGQSGSRCAEPTDYAISQGIWVDSGDNKSNSSWWLKSPLKSSGGAVDVLHTGCINEGGSVCCSVEGVRPVITLNGASAVKASGSNGAVHVHTLVHLDAVPATCFSNGFCSYYVCLGCKRLFSDDQAKHETSLLNLSIKETNIHTIVEDKAVKRSCTTDGKTAGKHCSVCGEVFVLQKTVKAKGHKLVKDRAVQPTFTSFGKTAGKHCKVCKKVIVPQKTIAKLGLPKLEKLKKGKKSFTAKWNLVSGVDGYQVQYSLKKNMKNSKKKKLAPSKSKVKIKHLKGKKKYYVRIRAYKKIKHKKYYSSWSPVKCVKVK